MYDTQKVINCWK